VIAGKSILAFRREPEEKPELSGRCFAFVQTYDEKPRQRLWEVMKSQGMHYVLSPLMWRPRLKELILKAFHVAGATLTGHGQSARKKASKDASSRHFLVGADLVTSQCASACSFRSKSISA